MSEEKQEIPLVGEDEYDAVLAELRGGSAQLIDVREEREWDEAHFKCAVHAPLSLLVQGKGLEKAKEAKEAGKSIYISCRSGNRARTAHDVLRSFGCTAPIRVIPITMVQMMQKGFLLAK